MAREGFTKVLAVPYDSEKTLDLVYCRGCKVTFPSGNSNHGRHLSDHPYMAFTVELE